MSATIHPMHPVAKSIYDAAIKLRRTSTKEIERGPDGIQRVHELAIDPPDVLIAAGNAALRESARLAPTLEPLARVQVLDAIASFARAQVIHQPDRRHVLLEQATAMDRLRDQVLEMDW